MGKQVLRTQNGLGHRRAGRVPTLGWLVEEAIPLFVLLGAWGAASPFLVPSSDGGELLASPPAAEQPGWPMDMPEDQAGGPTAKSK